MNIQHKIAGLIFALIIFYSAATHGRDTTPGKTEALRIPEFSSSAITGTEILQQLEQTTPSEAQAIMVEEILGGNLPRFLRGFKRVTWVADAGDGQGSKTVSIWVLPDYLSVGSDEDYLRVPLTPQSAQKVADALGCVLPTTRMVDQIYAAAEVKLEPAPFSPNQYDISNPETWGLSQTTITKQLEVIGGKAGQLVAGVKKDVVITRRLAEPGKENNVAIYGWHRLDGKPIQPLSMVHVDHYVDYSHGVRLVLDKVDIDGTTDTLKSVLVNPALAHLFSSEGPLTTATLGYNY